MKNRNWLTAVIIAALLGAVGWGYWERLTRDRLAYALEADYQREFGNVISQVEQVNVLLAKSLASNSPLHNTFYLTEVWNRASNSQEALSQLPFTGLNLSASRKFLAQLGDYAYSLARMSARGDRLSEQEWDKLSDFHNQIGRYSRDLVKIQNSLAAEGFRWSRGAYQRRRGVAQAAADHFDGLARFDQEVQQLPSMMYDGPFSDHLENRQPLGITGSPVTEDEARRQALSLADIPPDRGYRVTSVTRAQGIIPSYAFVLQGSAPGSVTASLSRTGGHLLFLLNSRSVDKAQLSRDEAEERARGYLSRLQVPDPIVTSDVREDNTIVFSFAPRQGEVVIYPDLVKVRIALDNGQVIGVEASSYFMSHRQRELPVARLSPTEARTRLSQKLHAGNYRLAVIPLPGGRETLAYEFRATLNSDPFLVYINALTGEEEEILKVLQQPNGEVTL